MSLYKQFAISIVKSKIYLQGRRPVSHVRKKVTSLIVARLFLEEPSITTVGHSI